ncbi:MAG TPA: hypothetical protein PKM25_03110 [Candidatus Ozemobacteraceae bacterium]|nr:hypothetical protein [Candidatus Ozemobacteraceae bacterium]
MNQEFSGLAAWRQAACRHPFWILTCVCFVLYLEMWYWRYPPRGYESTDVLAIGESVGEPLVSFSRMWDRLYNDDSYMIDVMIRAGWPVSGTRETFLRELNSAVRPGLSYVMRGQGLAEIKFTQGTIEYLRPLLRAFTTQLLQQLRTSVTREFEKRRFRAAVGIEVLTRRRIALQNMFQIFDAGRLMEWTFGQPLPTASPEPETAFAGRMASASLVMLAGHLTIDSVHYQETMAWQAWSDLIASDPGPIVMAPREPLLLTDPLSPPRLVQPLGMSVYLFIPFACMLVCAAGLMLAEGESPRLRQAAGKDAA